MTQRDICRAVGIADSTLSQKMKGKADWAIRDLEAVSRVLHVSVPELVGTLPDRSEWERRRPATEPVLAAPGPRFLLGPDLDRDASNPLILSGIQPDTDCRLSAIWRTAQKEPARAVATSC
ncbi:helix-turn-helix transcriptional regulator [Nocardioides sp.]|uniref:helix-turn-helix domain-containing protein n=1 Tax=Nocardioides sp. TaxID=35761 RepID=UPI0034560F90